MEDKKKAHAVFVFLNVLWTVLIIAAALTLLVLLTVFLHWWKTSIFILLGLIAGLSLASIRERTVFQAGLLLASLVAALFAFSLARLGATKAGSLLIYSKYLYAFLTWAAVTFLSELTVLKILGREFHFSPPDVEKH